MILQDNCAGHLVKVLLYQCIHPHVQLRVHLALRLYPYLYGYMSPDGHVHNCLSIHPYVYLSIIYVYMWLYIHTYIHTYVYTVYVYIT